MLSVEHFADITSHDLHSVPVLQIRKLKLREVTPLP